MGVQLNRNVNYRLYILYKACSLVGCQQGSHILNVDRVSACFLYALSVVHVILVGENLAQSIGDSHLCMALLLIGSLDSCLQVPDVVEGIEDPDDVDTVSDRLLYEVFYQVRKRMQESKVAPPQHSTE